MQGSIKELRGTAKNTMTKSITKGNQGRNLEAEMEAEAIEECTYWLAPHTLLRLLPYLHQDHLPRAGTLDSVRGSPTVIINQENTQQACPQVSVMEAISPLRFFSWEMI